MCYTLNSAVCGGGEGGRGGWSVRGGKVWESESVRSGKGLEGESAWKGEGLKE